MTTHNKTPDEIAKEAHLEWLSKADTAKIRDSESTVILYGYLSQAVKKAVTQDRLTLLTEIERRIDGTKPVGMSRYQNVRRKVLNEAKSIVREVLSNEK